MDSQSIWEQRLPQFPEPLWRETAELPTFESLSTDITTDVTIVGGGISGITTAYLLSKQGVKVALLDAGNILNGITGHTTAKLTAQHGLIFDELINHFGEEKAKLYYQANMDGLAFVKNTLREFDLDCDFTSEDAYIYTNSEQKLSAIEKEAEAYEKLGIPGGIVTEMPLSVEMKSAIVMRNQGQYHPLKFLKRLVQYITDAGGKIYENTTAMKLQEGASPVVKTRNGHQVTSNSVVVATHFPFNDKKGFYYARMYQDRSYLLACRMNKTFPGGMYINAESPSRSLRQTTQNGEQLVIVVGESHKTGHGTNTMKHYTDLAQFGDDLFEIKEIVNRWSTQDITTLDKVPYIGHMTENSKNIYVATGFRKWGMTNGFASGLLLTDYILGKDNPYKELFSPSRFHADPDIKTFVSQNLDVAQHYVTGKIDLTDTRIEDIPNDDARIIKVNNKRTGCYKDKEGKTFLVDTTCTHMGCEVEWNNAERSWDCPCHGSRFSYTGDVLEGPAKSPLKNRIINE